MNRLEVRCGNIERDVHNKPLMGLRWCDKDTHQGKNVVVHARAIRKDPAALGLGDTDDCTKKGGLRIEKIADNSDNTVWKRGHWKLYALHPKATSPDRRRYTTARMGQGLREP